MSEKILRFFQEISKGAKNFEKERHPQTANPNKHPQKDEQFATVVSLGPVPYLHDSELF